MLEGQWTFYNTQLKYNYIYIYLGNPILYIIQFCIFDIRGKTEEKLNKN